MSPKVVCGAENPGNGSKCWKPHGHDGYHRGIGTDGVSYGWSDSSPPGSSAFTPLVAETARLEIERLKRELADARLDAANFQKLNESLSGRVAAQSELLSKRAVKCDCLGSAGLRVDEILKDWKAGRGDPELLSAQLCGAMRVYDALRDAESQRRLDYLMTGPGESPP